MKQHYDKSWTLFLDRDGVINRHLAARYVLNEQMFEFIPGVLEAIPQLNEVFGRIVVVTNQMGIHKGLMTEADLLSVHAYMLNHIEAAGGFIDAVYYCPEFHGAPCRKPQPGMALQAKAAFPEIDFERSVMLGDSLSDMLFGQKLGMEVYHVLGGSNTPHELRVLPKPVNGQVQSLLEFTNLAV